MHKIRYTTILLLAVFCIIPIVSILMIHHLTLTDTLSKMGSGSLGKSAAILKIENYDTVGDLTSALSAVKGDHAIYFDDTEDDSTLRYMYFNRNYINLPMKEGRFFKASDFTEDNAVCVVGKGKVDETYKKGDDTYCNPDGREYRVIGVLGYESSTVLDDYIFVNMLSADLKDAGIFTFDFFDISVPDERAEEMIDYYTDKGIRAEVCSQAASFSESVMPQVFSARWFICLLAACFLCLLLISVRWVEHQKRELAIHRLVGASKKNIAVLIVCKYLAVFVISFVVGFVYCHIIYPAYFASLISGYLISIAFIIVFLIWSIFYILRTPIEEVIQ
ncbi:ABC transporter permease [Ruminococcus albus]|uniref:MacB-like core domain-containing protein n=1 Tax=Ruminococcus albus TaxID=1264 RepID=A0A1H7GQ09_RUMAL|nr:ABC transporter permease [Ruminococcus albus]SEK40161.1 MacB-like core domain-containing protein [Ruminococcus albus]